VSARDTVVGMHDGGTGSCGRWVVLSIALFAGCSELGPMDDPSVASSPPDASFGSDGSPRSDAATRPDGPPRADASLPSTDAAPLDAGAPVDADVDGGMASSFDCGPADAGVQCSCGSAPYFPPPTDGSGAPQTTVRMPEAAAVVAYHSLAEFDALAVGRWQRTAGQGELTCEQFGVEFTADHLLIPLVIASDGSVQPAVAFDRSFSISFDDTGAPKWLLVGTGLQTNPPIFFDGGGSMYLLYAPWPANYVRAP
jgi:hypothetical protein